MSRILSQQVASGTVLHFGGHDSACGVSFAREKIFELQDALHDAVTKAMDSQTIEEQKLTIDGEISLLDLNDAVLKEISSLAYDGESFPEPLFVIPNLSVRGVKASRSNPQNIQLSLRDATGRARDIWAWKFADTYESIGRPDKIAIAGQVKRDFMDRRRVTFRIVDMKAS